VIHMNYRAAQVDQVYFPQVEIVGDLALSAQLLLDQLKDAPPHDLTIFYKVRDHVLEKTHEGALDDRFPILPQRLVADVRSVMGDHDIIALDNGVYKIWFARNYPAHEPNTVLLDNALATMGAGLPSAMMASLLYPERKVVAICGDGGFMMNSQELETCVRLKLNIVVLVLNDGSYGMIRWKQGGAGFDDWGLKFGNPNFVDYTNSYGATGHRLSSAKDLIPMINQAFKTGGTHLIDVPIDYSQNKRLLIDELRINHRVPSNSKE